MKVFFLRVLLVLLVHPLNWTNANPVALGDLQSCISFPRECIEGTQLQLESLEPETIDWYRAKHLLISALWVLQENEILPKEVAYLSTLDNAPPVLLATAYTIHAKLLIVGGQKELGREFAEKAVDLIKAVNEVNMSAKRYAEVVNLFNYLEDWQRAEEFAHWAADKLKSIKNPDAMPDFYTAIGHIYFKSDKFELAKVQYQSSLDGYLQTQNAIEIANSYHNIARCYQQLGQWAPSIARFELALFWFNKQGKDYNKENKTHSQLRLTETLMMAGEIEQAKALMSSVEQEHIPSYFQSLHDDIKVKLVALDGQ